MERGEERRSNLLALYDLAGQLENSGCRTPVSYTHLDVYKRQALASAETMASRYFMEMPCRSAISFKGTYWPGGCWARSIMTRSA